VRKDFPLRTVWPSSGSCWPTTKIWTTFTFRC
jgi:hypothetical protein